MTKKRLTPVARKLRRKMTDAEERLWYHLRNRQLEGFKFRAQSPIGPPAGALSLPLAASAVESARRRLRP